jgi:hypothetical protein
MLTAGENGDFQETGFYKCLKQAKLIRDAMINKRWRSRQEGLLQNKEDPSIEDNIEQLLTLAVQFGIVLEKKPLKLATDGGCWEKKPGEIISAEDVRHTLKLARMTPKLPPRFLIPPVNSSFTIDLKRLHWMKGGYSILFSGIQFEPIVLLV